MTREDIIRMAKEADFIPIAALNHAESLHRFADLVLADNSSMVWQQGCDAGRWSEREACAKVCDEQADSTYWEGAYACARLIRARGEHMIEKIGCVQHDCDECVARLAQDGALQRTGLQIAIRQWEDWKTYALELQKKLVKYEGGSPMILNAQPKRLWVGLTPTDMEELSAEWWEPNENETTLIAWVEAKLKEKNFD